MADEEEKRARADGGGTDAVASTTAEAGTEMPASSTTEMGTDPMQQPSSPSSSHGPAGDFSRLQKLHGQHKRYKVPRHPLDLNWSFGFNTAHPAVYLLEDTTKSDVTFFSGHTGVILRRNTKDQAVLQGHRHAITASCVSADSRWIATGDTGEDATLIVWDTSNNLPIRTYFEDQVQSGVQAACFSRDALFLIVIALSKDGASRQARVYAWTDADASEPVCTAVLDGIASPVIDLAPHPRNPRRAIANTANEALFLSWEKGDALSVETVTDDSPSARLTASSFLPDEHTAVSATTKGEVIMWTRADVESGFQALKRIPASTSAVNTLCLTPDNRFLVLGCADGCVRCFDHKGRAMGWNEDLEAGAITAVSFATNGGDTDGDGDIDDPYEHLEEPTPETFSRALPNFVVSTSEGLIVNIVTGAEFMPSVVMHSQVSGITDVAVHPCDAIVASCSTGGAVHMTRYDQGQHLLSRNLNAGATPTAMAFSNDGHTLGIGYGNGTVDFRDAMTLDLVTETTTVPAASATVLQIAFAHTGEFAAAAFADSAVGLFKLDPADLETPWTLVGRNKSHVGGVTQVLFEEDSDSKHRCTLYSIGKDGMMVSYDLDSTFDTQLQLHEPRLRLSQGTYPLDITSYRSQHLEEFRITANADYKLKLYNKSTNMCRRTVLGPIYGDPVSHLVAVPSHPDHLNHQILAFANSDKVGLCLAPLNGNPHRYIAILAHPDKIACLRVSHDGKFLFTAGVSSGSVHMWQLNPAVLAASVQTAPQGMDALYELVEGGRSGELINDLKEYFYYAQIRRHGLTSMAPIEASDTLPLSDIADVLRAVGFFPTEHQIVEMTNEIKFKDYYTTQEYKTSVDLDDLVTLFVNHRPALGLAPSDLRSAFSAIAPDTEGGIASSDLYQLLQEVGDRMTEDELARCLATLLGDSRIDEALPPRVDADTFAEDIVGFEV